MKISLSRNDKTLGFILDLTVPNIFFFFFPVSYNYSYRMFAIRSVNSVMSSLATQIQA